MSSWYLLLDGHNVQVVKLTEEFVETFGCGYPCTVLGPYVDREQARKAVRTARLAQKVGWAKGFSAARRMAKAHEAITGASSH